MYCKNLNKRPASFYRSHPISARGKLQKLNMLVSNNSFPARGKGRASWKNLVLFKNVGWLFESYLVFSGVI